MSLCGRLKCVYLCVGWKVSPRQAIVMSAPWLVIVPAAFCVEPCIKCNSLQHVQGRVTHIQQYNHLNIWDSRRGKPMLSEPQIAKY